MKSNIAAAAILNFGYMAFSVEYSDFWRYFVPTHEIWTKSLNPGQSYGYFFCKIQDGGRPPFWNCNDVIYDYPRWVFGNVMSVLNFHSNKLLSFEDIEIFFYPTQPGLSDHAPFLKGFWGIWPSKCGRPSCGHPKRHTLAWFRVIWVIVRQNRPTGYFSRRVVGNKNKNKKERPYSSRIWPDAPSRPICTKFGLRVCLMDVINNIVQSFIVIGWRVWILWGSNFDLPIGMRWCRH